MRLDSPLHNGKTETGTARSPTNERIEQAFPEFRGNPWAIVGHA